MKVIFLSDVKKQAKKDEIKDVKDGYAKFLISSGYAVPYSEKSVEVLNTQIKKRQDDEDELVKGFNEIKDKLVNKVLTFKVKTGENDRVFGSISSKQISEELDKLGFKIDKKKIETGELNTLGTHNVKITLHKKVSFEMSVVLTK